MFGSMSLSVMPPHTSVKMSNLVTMFTTGRRRMLLSCIIGLIGSFVVWHRYCKRGSAEVGRFGLVEDSASEASF